MAEMKLSAPQFQVLEGLPIYFIISSNYEAIRIDADHFLSIVYILAGKIRYLQQWTCQVQKVLFLQ